MTKFQKNSLYVFLILFVLAVVFSYVVNMHFDIPAKPWHMQPFQNEDSLSVDYHGNYSLLDRVPLSARFYDSSQVNVFILVDAWGVPFDVDSLENDFSFFGNVPHSTYLHYRLANRTRHAEHVELRQKDSLSIFIFGGDSLEYGRKDYIPRLGFGQDVFFQKCDDSIMLSKIDSLLNGGEYKSIAWTTQNSRDGNLETLRKTLMGIANIAKRHRDVRFVVQGTHRPILGTPEVRKKYYAHWVPVVVIGGKDR